MMDLEADMRDLKVAKYFKERSGLRADTEIIAIKAIERAIKAEAEVERLRMALDKIANPLKYIQMEARAKGAELNGVYAIMLSKDPSYLQEIAIAELDKDKGD